MCVCVCVCVCVFVCVCVCVQAVEGLKLSISHCVILKTSKLILLTTEVKLMPPLSFFLNAMLGGVLLSLRSNTDTYKLLKSHYKAMCTVWLLISWGSNFFGFRVLYITKS